MTGGGRARAARPRPGAPQVIADSLRDLMDALNRGHRAVAAVEEAELERAAELRRQVEDARRKAFERGRRAGYAQGLEDGRRLAPAERETVYAAGMAEGAALASGRNRKGPDAGDRALENKS